MCRFTIDDHGSSLSSRATTRLSGSVSYRVGRARPFMPTDFQRRTERPLARGHPRTPRVRVRGPKWQSCSVSYVTPPRLLCFSLFSRKSLGNIYIYNSLHDFDRSFEDRRAVLRVEEGRRGKKEEEKAEMKERNGRSKNEMWTMGRYRLPALRVAVSSIGGSTK